MIVHCRFVQQKCSYVPRYTLLLERIFHFLATKFSIRQLFQSIKSETDYAVCSRNFSCLFIPNFDFLMSFLKMWRNFKKLNPKLLALKASITTLQITKAKISKCAVVALPLERMFIIIPSPIHPRHLVHAKCVLGAMFSLFSYK